MSEPKIERFQVGGSALQPSYVMACHGAKGMLPLAVWAKDFDAVTSELMGEIESLRAALALSRQRERTSEEEAVIAAALKWHDERTGELSRPGDADLYVAIQRFLNTADHP